jgi:hypothetical protein
VEDVAARDRDLFPVEARVVDYELRDQDVPVVPDVGDLVPETGDCGEKRIDGVDERGLAAALVSVMSFSRGWLGCSQRCRNVPCVSVQDVTALAAGWLVFAD